MLLYLTGVQIDIVDGPLPSVGRVQITYDGVPGSICTEEWTDNDASLVNRTYRFVITLKTTNTLALVLKLTLYMLKF